MVGNLETVKTVSDVASNAATIIAIVVGAIWGYWAFLRERTRWPKATLELVISHRELTAEKALLHTKVKVHNAGRGLMKLSRIRIDAYQVRPLAEESKEALDRGELVPKDEHRANWNLLERVTLRWDEEQCKDCAPEIEPGENDEYIGDFVVPSNLETVFVYVYVKNVARKRGNLGWPVTNYYDLKGQAGGESAVNVISSESVGNSIAEETS
jgi:hypothetical protein